MHSNILIPELEFKKNFTDCVTRHQALQHATRGCLIKTIMEDDAGADQKRLQMPVLENLDFDADPLLMPKTLCDWADRFFAAHANYPDDSIPYLSPSYGTGIIGGMLLGQLQFGSNTSWTSEFGRDLDETIEFPWGQETIWIERVIKALNYMAKRMAGKCYVFMEGYHTPLEWAALIRGSSLYMELITEPEKTHELLRRSETALIWLYDLIESRVEKKEYGALAHSLWMERCVPFLSDDSAGLLSPEHYAEFGAPYTDAMFRRYGGGFLHFHALAYHQLDNLRNMTAMTMHNWREDPNIPRAAEVLDRILPGAKSKILMLRLTADEIREKIDLLSQGRFFINAVCRDRKEQEEIIRFVHERAPIIHDEEYRD